MEPWRLLDSAGTDQARRLLTTCCGAPRWVEGMLAQRPFGSADRLLDAARRVWQSLTPADWREAFAHHPRIGDLQALRARFSSTRHLAAREQAGVAEASDATITALAEANAAYEQRFGYIFIVCASGRTADEMLALLRTRLDNDPDREIHVAADEQARITQIRLAGIASLAS